MERTSLGKAPMHEAPRAEGQGDLLQIRDLSIGYKDPDRRETICIVRDVNLSLGRREVVGLVGESGSGKTQTARAILRINTPPLRPLSGTIDLDGVDILALPPGKLRTIRGERVAMIFQDPRASLNPLMRVGDQLARIFALHQHISSRAAHDEALNMLRRVGIAGPERVARSYPHQLSGGMCQRVMISIALGMEPDLLIADEPTTGLDVTIQAQILDLIEAMQHETGASVLLITHDLGVVAEICQRVAVMYRGRVVEVAPVDDIFTAPVHPYTIRLLTASVAVEAPDKKVAVKSGSNGHVEFSAGHEQYTASLATVEDASVPSSLVEVSPGHLVLGTPRTADAVISSTPAQSGQTGAAT